MNKEGISVLAKVLHILPCLTSHRHIFENWLFRGVVFQEIGRNYGTDGEGDIKIRRYIKSC